MDTLGKRLWAVAVLYAGFSASACGTKGTSIHLDGDGTSAHSEAEDAADGAGSGSDGSGDPAATSDASGDEVGGSQESDSGSPDTSAGSSGDPTTESSAGSTGSGSTAATEGSETGAVPTCTELDVLFVIDDSASMEDEQGSLIAAFPEFRAELNAVLGDVDVHWGVATTGDGVNNSPGCQTLGGLVERTGGLGSSNARCGPFARGNFLSDDDANLDDAFACVAAVGLEGSGNERPAEAMLTAFDPDLAGPGRCNAGFRRADTPLAVVIVTDEEDDFESDSVAGSAENPDDWARDLTTLAGSADKAAIVGLIGPPGDILTACPPRANAGAIEGADPSPRLAEFIRTFPHHVVGRICDADYRATLSAAVDAIAGACSE